MGALRSDDPGSTGDRIDIRKVHIVPRAEVLDLEVIPEERCLLRLRADQRQRSKKSQAIPKAP
jgi:hypothetical protein